MIRRLASPSVAHSASTLALPSQSVRLWSRTLPRRFWNNNICLPREFHWPFEEEVTKTLWQPNCHVVDHPTKTEIKVELPGVDKSQINVEFKDGLLSIHGEKSEEIHTEEFNVIRNEITTGSFHRSFRLPKGTVLETEVEASFRNGVLNVTVPKPQKVEPPPARKIAITGDDEVAPK